MNHLYPNKEWYEFNRSSGLPLDYYRGPGYVLKPLLIAIAVCLAGLAMICLGQA